MPTYTFPTDIEAGDIGQAVWGNAVSAALNQLGPLVGNAALYIGGTAAPTESPAYLWLKENAAGNGELWIEDGD